MGKWVQSRAAIVLVTVVLSTVAVTAHSPGTASVQFHSAAGVAGRLAAGEAHTCGIDADGAVWCWGKNSNGQLGDATFVDPSSSTPRRSSALPGGRIAETVVAGDNHTCVLANDDTVWCWGHNSSGQLGLSGANRLSPTQVPTISAVSLGAGGNTTCAGLTDGTARCWGANASGQWGNNTTSAPDPGTLATVAGVKAAPGTGEFALASVDVGFSHVCAVAADGSAWCWGSDADGRLGSSASGAALVPRGTAALGAAAEQTSAGASHTCAVLTGGVVSCFGANTSGEIGRDPATVTSSNTPATVSGLSGVTRVSSGSWFTCAVASGQVRCFGIGDDGQRGDGVLASPVHVPSTVTSITATVVDVAAGAEHACAVDATGGVWCWGRNSVGQLGRGTTSARSSNAQRLTGLTVGTTTTTTTTTVPASLPVTTSTTLALVASPEGTTSSTVSPTMSPTTSSVVSPTTSLSTSVLTAATSRGTATQRTKATTRTLSLKRTRSLSAARIATAAGLAIPRKSQGTMRISIVTGRSVCRFVGSSVQGVRRGRCSLRVVLVPTKGRTLSRTVNVKVA